MPTATKAKKPKITTRIALSKDGSEHPYSYYPWGEIGGGSNSNNCYAYAMHDWESYRVHKAQPGNVSGMSNKYHSYSNCRGLAKRVLSDNPGKVFTVKTPTAKCPSGCYKVMLFISPKGVHDFHWYKQHGVVMYRIKSIDTINSISKFFKVPYSRIKKAVDLKGGFAKNKLIVFKANVWSHKRGWGTGPTLKDAKGSAILNPMKAARKYGELNYSKLCNTFCVKNRGVDVGKTKANVIKKR